MNKISKLKNPSESGGREKNLLSISHSIADKAFVDLVRILSNEISLVTGEITGNEYLSVIGTFISKLTSCFIFEMHRASQYDDTKFTKEEIIDSIFDAILEQLNSNKETIRYYNEKDKGDTKYEFKTIC